jgi:hypothetical protein
MVDWWMFSILLPLPWANLLQFQMDTFRPFTENGEMIKERRGKKGTLSSDFEGELGILILPPSFVGPLPTHLTFQPTSEMLLSIQS